MKEFLIENFMLWFPALCIGIFSLYLYVDVKKYDKEEKQEFEENKRLNND